MCKVWGENGDMSKALIHVNSQDKHEQEKVFKLSTWIIKYVRNPNAHQVVEKTEKSALAHLHQINVIASALDESIFVKTGKPLVPSEVNLTVDHSVLN